MSNRYILEKIYSIFNVRGEMMLEMNMEFRKGILFVRLRGSLNRTTSCKLQEELERLIREKGIKYFAFNLEEVEDVSQEGIDIIRKDDQEIASFDGKLVLCGIKDALLRTSFEDVYQSNNELGVFKIIQV